MDAWLCLWILNILSRKISHHVHFAILNFFTFTSIRAPFYTANMNAVDCAYLLERYFSIVTWEKTAFFCLALSLVLYDIPHWVCHAKIAMFAEVDSHYPSPIRLGPSYSSCNNLSFYKACQAFVAPLQLQIQTAMHCRLYVYCQQSTKQFHLQSLQNLLTTIFHCLLRVGLDQLFLFSYLLFYSPILKSFAYYSCWK